MLKPKERKKKKEERKENILSMRNASKIKKSKERLN